MFQEAAVKSRAQAKGVHQVDAEKKNGFIRFRVWDYFTLCTERGLWVHIKHKHKEGILPWFGILPWRENVGEPKVTKRSAFNPSLVPEPQLWRECQQQCGVLPVWLHLCSLQPWEPQRLLQEPSSLHRDKLNTQKRGQGKTVSASRDRRGTSSPAVSALGGQWIQCSAPEWNEAKLARNREHTMEHRCWDTQETSKV